MSNPFLEFNARIAALENRMTQMMRPAPVHEVNAAEHWVRLKLGDGENGPLLSPKIPYAQIAGGLKVHAPPTVGQNMMQFSPGGDTRQAIAVPMTWSDANASPSGSAEENVLTFGSVRIELKGGGLKVTVGGVSVDITGDGVTFTGGQIDHDGHLIDRTHVHTEVTPGGALSGPPP